MAIERDPEDGALVAWDETRTIRISTISAAAPPGEPPLEAERMLGDRRGPSTANPHGVLVASSPRAQEGSDVGRLTRFESAATVPNHLLVVSLYSRDND